MYRYVLACLLLSATAPAQVPSITGFGSSAPALTPVAPGQILTLYVQGIKLTLDKPIIAGGYPLPTSLGGVSVTLRQNLDDYATAVQAPILSLSRTYKCDTSSSSNLYNVFCAAAITIQVPYELAAGDFRTQNLGIGNRRAALVVSENGVEGSAFSVLPLSDQVQIVGACDPGFAKFAPGTDCPLAVTHADGTLVSPRPPGSPAKEGETLTLYAFGLGQAYPTPLKTGERTPHAASWFFPTSFKIGVRLGAGPDFLQQPLVDLLSGHFLPGQTLVAPDYVGPVEGYAGLYQVNFTIPQLPFELPSSCPYNFGNVTVTLGSANGFSGGGICIVR